VTDAVQGPDVDTGVDPPGQPPPKTAASFLKSLPLAVQIALGIVLAAGLLAGGHAVFASSTGCPAGTYKDVSYLTGNTFCGSIAPTTTSPPAPATRAPSDTTHATPAATPPTTAAPPVTAPTPNYVGMSVTAAENAPSTDNGWTVSGANETCDGGATDYVVSQSPAAGTVETADGLGGG
jgi:hypothetical protein